MGELVEMYVIVDDGSQQLDENARIRFDILEQDHILTGGRDDQMVSYMGPNVPPPDEGFRRESKTTHFQEMPECQEVLATVQRYQDDHLPDISDHILILKKPGETIRFHIFAWWVVQRAEGFLDPEFYFIVNIDDDFEDQSEPILDVTRTDLNRMFAEHQLHDRHMANVLFRRRLESMSPNEVQRFLQNVTERPHRAYLLRILDFVRDQGILQEAPLGERERITFIMGQQEPLGRTNQFYRSATRYFQLNPAGILVNEPRTLESVRNYLENNQPDNRQPWGEINIVVHANEEGGMSIPVFAGEENMQPYTLRPAVDTPLLFVVDISNHRRFLTQLQDTDNPMSNFLLRHFSGDLRQVVDNYRPDDPDEQLLQDVTDRLSWLMQRRSLYSEPRLSQDELSQEIQRLIEQNPEPQSVEFIRLNRLLLQQVYVGIELSQEIQRLIEQNPEPQSVEFIRLNRLLLQQVYTNCIRQYPQAILAERELGPLPNQLVDARTIIRIRGCALGRNQDILRLLSVAFGGSEMQRSIVRAPKHLQHYSYNYVARGRRRQITGADESLIEFWFVGFPHGQRPAEEVLLAEFEEKYPYVDVDWRGELPRAVLRTRRFQSGSEENPHRLEYRPVPRNRRELRRLIRASIQNTDRWRQIRETRRINNADGSITVHFSFMVNGNPSEGEIPVGPNPPRTEDERLAFLRDRLDPDIFNQYSWAVQTNDRAIGNGERAFTMIANGRRTILRIQRPLQARLQPLFDVALGPEANLDNRTISGDLRQVFRDNCAPLSEEAIVYLRVVGNEWLLLDPEVKRTYVVLLENDQLNLFVERPFDSNAEWQGSMAHPAVTDPTHFGEEVSVWEPQRPLGQNILPE